MWFKHFFSAIWHLITGVAQAAISDFEQKIVSAGPELLTLAIDAVEFVAVELPGVGGDVAAREAAITKLKVDASAVGIDLATWAKNELNALIELAYVAAKPAIAAGTPTVAKVQAAAPASE